MSEIEKSSTEYHLSEEMIELYHNMEASLIDTNQPVIQFIGACKNEGVTTISREFANVAANIFGRSVLVLDPGGSPAKMRSQTPKPSKDIKPKEKRKKINAKAIPKIGKDQDNRNSSSNENESINYIKDLVSQDSPYPYISENHGGLNVGSLSELGLSSSILFTNQYFERMITLIKKKYDLVIIDTPPVSESSIGLAISRKADGVILVVAAGSTRWQTAVKIKSKIENAGGVLLGTILNKQKHFIPNYL